jgi:hypothetical protein
MNGYMKVSLPTLRLLLGMFALLLISACSDDGSSSSSPTNELKTKNLYFTSNDTSNEIRSFNPKTGKDIPIANFDSGENTLLTLNTDNDEQGYEKIIYSLNNAIYLMDAENTKTKLKLASFATDVCLFSSTIPDQLAFEGSTKGERILVDQSIIFVAPQTNTGCDTEAAKIKKIDFTDTNGITVHEVSAANLWGETLFDYDYKPSLSEDNQDPGRYGFLGSSYNALKSSLQLNFYDHESNLLWETSFPAPDSLPTIKQVTQSDVLIQIGGDLYVKDIKNLFDIATTSGPDDIPTGSLVEALFEVPLLSLSDTDIKELQTASNGSSFVLVGDGKIFFYDGSLPTDKKFMDLELNNESALALQIEMMDNGTLLLHRKFADSEALIRVNTTSKAPDSIVARDQGTNNKVDFYTQDNNIYLNILSQIDRQAAWLNTSFSRVDIENSLFAFSENYRSANSNAEILLISSDEEITPEGFSILTNAKLYTFDPKNRTTGRKRYKDEDNINHDFIFGEFSVDIVDIKEVSISEIFNDVYGKLKLKTARFIDSDMTETYFFNPTETKSLEAKKTNNKALQLIESKENQE